MNELHLFAGAGGGILGGILLGHRTVCAVEIEPYCRRVLLQRQRDGILPRFPIWDDVRTFDGTPWRGIADVVCGGFPCQDISVAGRGAGIEGERSGLWGEMARIISEVQPRFIFVENSPALAIRGLGRVLGDLAALGFDAEWGVLGACDTGLEMLRERIWILARNDGNRVSRLEQAGSIGEIGQRRKDRQKDLRVVAENPFSKNSGWPQPLLRRGDDGLADRVDRIRAIGNGQVPAVAALAWKTLKP